MIQFYSVRNFGVSIYPNARFNLCRSEMQLKFLRTALNFVLKMEKYVFLFHFLLFYCVLLHVTVYVGCLSGVINDDDINLYCVVLY